MIPAVLPINRALLGWVLLAAVLALLGAYHGGQYIGARDERTAAEARLVATMQAMAAQAAEQAIKDGALAQRHTRARAELRRELEHMNKEVNDYVDTTPDADVVCLDDVGLQLWNAERPTAAKDSTGPPHRAVPAAAEGDSGHQGGVAGESARDQGSVLRNVFAPR